MKRTRLSKIGKSDASKLQKICDTKLQTIGRKRFKKCEICGQPMYCLHHFYTKQSSNRLRYDWDNQVPICRACHYKHHRLSDPTIHGTVIKKRGQAWYDMLQKKKQETIKTDVPYYNYILEMLNNEK